MKLLKLSGLISLAVALAAAIPIPANPSSGVDSNGGGVNPHEEATKGFDDFWAQILEQFEHAFSPAESTSSNENKRQLLGTGQQSQGSSVPSAGGKPGGASSNPFLGLPFPFPLPGAGGFGGGFGGKPSGGKPSGGKPSSSGPNFPFPFPFPLNFGGGKAGNGGTGSAGGGSPNPSLPIVPFAPAGEAQETQSQTTDGTAGAAAPKKVQK